MKNEIAKRDETALKPISPAEAPELQPMEEGQPLKIPRLLIVQGNRAEIKDGLARPGEFMNSLTKEVYGRELTLVALCQRPATRIRWSPRNSGGGILCISRNKTKPSGEPGDGLQSCADCTFYRNFDPKEGCSFNDEIIALIVNGEDHNFWEPILVTAESTRPSDQGFRDILNMARYGYNRGIRMFHKSYNVKAIEATNKWGQFWKTSCSPGNKNGLLPLNTIEFLESRLPFFVGVKVHTEYDDTKTDGQAEVDPKTGAPKGW